MRQEVDSRDKVMHSEMRVAVINPVEAGIN